MPSCMGLFNVVLEEREGKSIVKIIVASGSEKPYYIKKKGLSESGCFLRVGSSSEPMPQRTIDDLYSKRIHNSIGRIISNRQDLTFEQLGSGVPRILETYSQGCFSFYDNFIRMTFPKEKESNQVSNQVSELDDKSINILIYCNSPKKRKEILEDCLGLSNQTKNFNNYIEPLLSLGLLYRTIPNVPKSQHQRYFTTEKGKKVITSERGNLE